MTTCSSLLLVKASAGRHNYPVARLQLREIRIIAVMMRNWGCAMAGYDPDLIPNSEGSTFTCLNAASERRFDETVADDRSQLGRDQPSFLSKSRVSILAPIDHHNTIPN
jgi:hypothetical protein